MSPLRFLLLLAILGFGIASAEPAEDTQRGSVAQKTELTVQSDQPDSNRAEQQARLAELAPSDITPSMVEQAELDVESARVQLEGARLDLQVAEKRNEELVATVQKLEQKLQESQDLSPSEGNPTPDANVLELERELQKNRTLLQEEQGRISSGKATLETARTELKMAKEWSTGLKELSRQAREASQQTVLEALKMRFEREQQQWQSRAAEWREKLQNRADGTPTEQHQLWRSRLYEAEEQARLAGQEIRIAQFEDRIASFESDLLNREMSAIQLESILEQITTIGAELEAGRALLDKRLKVLRQQHEVASKRDLKSEETEIYRELEQALNAQSAKMNELTTRATPLPNKVEKQLSEILHRGLTASRPLPANSDEWQQLIHDLARFPSVLTKALATDLNTLARGAFGLTVDRWLLLVVGLTFWLTFVSRTQQMLVARQAPRGGWGALLEFPLLLLERSARPIAVAGTAALLVWTFLPSNASAAPLIALLVCALSAYLLLNFSRTLLMAPGGVQKPRLYRQLQWTTLAVGSLGVVVATVHALSLAPSLVNFVDRVFMLSVLMFAVPMFEVRRLSLAYLDARLGERYWARVIRILSLLAPASVLAAASVGVAGYVNLAWAIGGLLATVLVILAVWLVTARLLREAGDSLKNYVNVHTDHGMLLAKGVIEPVHSLLKVIVFIALWALPFGIYGIGPETPVVSKLLAYLQVPLFSIGGNTVTLFGLVLALAAVLAVVRTGGWLRLVTYRWALSGITDQGVRHSLSVFSQYTFVLAGVLISLQLVGIDLTSVAIFAGALGVGIGFGLQNIANNFISGILLLVERPLRTHDIVRVGEHEGEVTHIGMRSLTVKTWDHQEVIMPNADVISNSFTNWTHNDNIVRTVVEVGISYDENPRRAAEVVATILRDHPAVLDEPPPQVWMKEFAASTVLFHVQYFIDLKYHGRLEIRSEILMAIWEGFREAGIRIPYPQLDIHMDRASPPAENLPPMQNSATIRRVRPS
ncbi:mechanosensitive ion channel domain-containing protein [Thiohalomonas denitrificans]|uniref:Potassium efflux system protein n=1 Tax=Thiohalomonas denitrificans TaxID=415747 RepID=A0A1G5PHV4_9GAMM|nr:mechanosensitive ion channel domain-containing protein [Thiohalomonas denitrificans]SCZ49074.1 potassium efflux system protein [Thiohalomonas denitrificans]